MPANSNIWIKKKFQELKKCFKNKCSECFGKCPLDSSLLEFAHIKPTEISGMGRGRKERYYDIIYHPDSYILCCPEKHSEIDNKFYNR